MLKISRFHTDAVRLQVFFVVAVHLVIAVAWAMTGLYDTFATNTLPDSGLLISHYRERVMPKPLERFVFLVLAVWVPVSVFTAGFAFFRRSTFLPKLSQRCSGALIRVVICLLYLPFLGFDVSFDGTSGLAAYHYLQIVIPAVSLGVAALWYSSRMVRHFPGKPFGHEALVSSRLFRQWTPWIVFLSIVLLQIASWRLFGENAVARSGDWDVDADAIFYSIGQVAAGRTLLADFPSQYGLYAMFLQPVFAAIGLSVFKVSAVYCALQVVSLAAAMAVVQSYLRDTAMRLAYALALIAVTFCTMLFLMERQNFYLQYWPTRFFWPAVALFAFHRYTRHHTLWRAAAVSFAGAIGSLWNADSGLIIVLSFAGALTARWYALQVCSVPSTAQERTHIFRAMGLHIAVVTACFLLAAAWLASNAGSAIDWDGLTRYQKTFYGLGFMMLPMPMYPSSWMTVLGIYLMGLMVAVQIWTFNAHSRFAELLVFLALLGTGLFVYYQGRAHPLNLVSVCWPAVTMTALLADRTLRAMKAGMLTRQYRTYPVAALSVLLILSMLVITCIPRMLSSAASALENHDRPADALVSGELLFIRKNTRPGDRCAILGLRQGIYHVATGTASPLSGPGYVEMLLQKDLDSFVGQLVKSPASCVFIGVGQFSALHLGMDLLKTLEPHYTVVGRSDTGTMVLMRPIGRDVSGFRNKND